MEELKEVRLVPLKEPAPVLNGQIQHLLPSGKNVGVEYSNIPVFGRKMLNEPEMGKSGGDKVVGESKGEQGKEKAIEETKIENNEEEEEEDENCNQNCEEVVCEDEDEIGEMKNGHNEARSANRKLYSSYSSPKSWSSPKSSGYSKLPSPPMSSDSSPGSQTPTGKPTIIKPPSYSNTPYGGSTYPYGGRYPPYYYGGTTYYYGSSNSSNCCCKKKTLQALVTNIYVSAYKGNGKVIIVAINIGWPDKNQQFSIKGIKSFTPIITAPNKNMINGTKILVNNGSFNYLLPAMSVVTFVSVN
uniref:Uncharacterized protein n=1 Tax=Meloidogyne javanica TaxID=6303 RepID=A0A915MYK6_MELJA